MPFKYCEHCGEGELDESTIEQDFDENYPGQICGVCHKEQSPYRSNESAIAELNERLVSVTDALNRVVPAIKQINNRLKALEERADEAS